MYNGLYMNTQTIKLNRGQIIVLNENTHKGLIRVRSGQLWLTESGRFEDIVLEAEEQRILGFGKVVVEALREAAFFEIEIELKINSEQQAS